MCFFLLFAVYCADTQKLSYTYDHSERSAYPNIM